MEDIFEVENGSLEEDYKLLKDFRWYGCWYGFKKIVLRS
jgi:hypothetical protein